jgi:O-antigen/teichoic acid export membrane protein
MTRTLQNEMGRGAAWMVLFKLVERSLGLVSTLILVRVLAPEDFGVVAMAMSFLLMAELLTAFGFDLALIHNQSATDEHYHSAWTGNFLLGCTIALITLAAAKPLAAFYGQPHLVPVVCALALGPLLGGLENIGTVGFRKNLQFQKEFVFQLSRKLAAFVVTIAIALWLRSYWALVIGTLVSRFMSTALSYAMHPFRPRFAVSRLRELIGFSKWLLLNNVFGFFKERSSDFVLGRFVGPTGLGLYNISYEFANLPTTELGAPINRALIPGFAKVQEDAQVGPIYSAAIGMVALLAIPAAAGVFAIAPLLVPVVLGPKWAGAVQLMELLAWSGVLLLFHSSMSAVIIARGQPKRVMQANATFFAIMLVALLVLVQRFGTLGAAYASVTAVVLSTPAYLYHVHRCIGVGPGRFVAAMMRPLLAALAMVVAVRLSLPAEPAQSASILGALHLLGSVVLGGAAYVAGVLALWAAFGRPAGPERSVLDRVLARLRPSLPGRLAS